MRHRAGDLTACGVEERRIAVDRHGRIDLGQRDGEGHIECRPGCHVQGPCEVREPLNADFYCTVRLSNTGNEIALPRR